ncbi:MAG: glycosyltransferase family 2 protein [Brevinematales bacterium]|nr:glycosyltransferase family 2 protein [Brevinematales bacterium]
MKISIIIPVYKEVDLLEDIISKCIYYEYEDKEIIIVIDGATNNEIEETLDNFRNIDYINIIYNNTRLGKVESLNRATDICNGELILFIDNDVELPNDKNFLKNLSKEFIGKDIIELAKEGISTNFFSKIISYDYLGGAIASIISSKTIGINLFLCGSAFAIRKEKFIEIGKFPKTINEDWSLMLKSFMSNIKFSYCTKLKVKTCLPTNINDWINQRKRWAIGMRYWWIEIFKNIQLYIKGLPTIALVGTIMGIPFLISLITSILVLDLETTLRIINISITVFQYIIPSLGIPSIGYLTTYILFGTKGIISLLIAIALNSLIFFLSAKLINFRFNLIEFILYSTIYVPILLSFYIIYGWFISLVDKSNIDWVIQSDTN